MTDSFDLNKFMEGDISSEGAYEILEVLKALETNFAWKYLLRFLEAQTTRRMSEMLSNTITNQESVYKEVFLKGELSGLQLAMGAPQLLRDHLESIREAAKTRQDSVDSSENEDGA